MEACVRLCEGDICPAKEVGGAGVALAPAGRRLGSALRRSLVFWLRMWCGRFRRGTRGLHRLAGFRPRGQACDHGGQFAPATDEFALTKVKRAAWCERPSPPAGTFTRLKNGRRWPTGRMRAVLRWANRGQHERLAAIDVPDVGRLPEQPAAYCSSSDSCAPLLQSKVAHRLQVERAPIPPRSQACTL